MESLVNYSSEDEQDDYPYKKVAVRERCSGAAAGSGRIATDVTAPLKRSYERAKIDSFESETSYRKGRECGNESFKSGSSAYNEDKYKIDRRAENSRDHKEKRDARELKYNRDARNEARDYDSSKKHDYKKVEDPKFCKEYKRDHKRDSNDYYRDEKRHSRYEEKKPSYTTNKDRFNSSRSRHDERKQYDDRYSDERRGGNGGGSSYVDDRRKEYDRRSYNNDDDRRSDRRTQRLYNDDRSNAYRPRRSSSPSLHYNKGNSKYSDRKDESNTRRERRRHSRSRTRSRTRSRSHSADKSIEPNLTASKSSNQKTVPSEHVGNFKCPDMESTVSERKPLPTARNFEALLTLPLSENAPKNPNVVTIPTPSVATGSNATTVQLPIYYNPNVINPNKYVEQMQKRKLIWGAKKVEDSASKWGHAQFSQDQDGKVASKFMRLMGIKNATSTGGDTSSSNESEKKSPPSNIDVKNREAMFTTMEHQYEVARQVTHTMRGVGLGFSSQSRPY